MSLVALIKKLRTIFDLLTIMAVCWTKLVYNSFSIKIILVKAFYFLMSYEHRNCNRIAKDLFDFLQNDNFAIKIDHKD